MASARLGSAIELPRANRQRTAHELVRVTLRHAILEGSLSGGTRLIQGEIAERLGVSATPVREALRDLATEGLIRLAVSRASATASTAAPTAS